jgi:hypothetical protein
MAKDLRTYLSNRRTRLPKPITVEVAADRIEQIHAEHGGATFSLYFGDMLGQGLYAVSLFPEPETALTIAGKDAPADVLRAFIGANRELLLDPRLCIGTWYQEDMDITFIDIVAVLPDRETALALGRQYNQIAVYDLAAGEEIDAGGSGEWIAVDVPPEQRLPRLKR